MRYLIMILCAFVAMAVPTAVIAILLMRMERPERPVRRAAAQPQMTSQFQSAPARGPGSFRGYWWMELINLNTGVRTYRAFCDRIILGRTLPFAEELGRWYVSDHPTVSRDQCVVTLSGGNAWLENLSHVNITGLNGYAVQMPSVLRIGDQLQLGAEVFALTNLGPCN